MEKSALPETASPIPSTGKRNWVWPVVGLVVILIAAAGIGWFGFRDTGSEGADEIQATWYWAAQDAYETLDGDGEWSVREGEGAVFDWGTYTFEDGVLTYFNADDSYCAGAVAVWEVAFSENGDELQQTFVSDSCNSARGQDRVLVRHTP